MKVQNLTVLELIDKITFETTKWLFYEIIKNIYSLGIIALFTSSFPLTVTVLSDWLDSFWFIQWFCTNESKLTSSSSNHTVSLSAKFRSILCGSCGVITSLFLGKVDVFFACKVANELLQDILARIYDWLYIFLLRIKRTSV